MEKKLMLGNEAVARGAYEAGVRVISSYPGTPSTEITEAAAGYEEMYVEWAPNEKVAAEVAIGASIAGGRAMTCMKHVGLNVCADPVFTASYTGVNGGLVIVVADDQGMHSSQNEQDSRHYAKASKIPMLEPSDSGEAKAFTKLAFWLSETFDTPVFIRMSTRVAHSQSVVELLSREELPLLDYQKDPGKYVMMPAMAKKRHVLVEERIQKLQAYAETAEINTVEKGNGKIGIIAAGIAYQYAKEALPEASFLKLGMVYPMPTQKILDFCNSVDEVYVIEELDPFIEEFCKSHGAKVVGKELFSLLGEYTPPEIREKILGISTDVPFDLKEEVPNRPPVMCAGCPHRATYYVLKKLGLTVSGDIGCYTLGALPPLGAIDTCVCMGASVSASLGMEKARGRDWSKKTVSVIGDSTFIHSGITGLINAVYNKSSNTVIILDNSITGMTGHQQNPTTGRTIRGEATKQVDLIKLSEAVGVDRVAVCDPFDLEKFEEIVKTEILAEEPSVIIAQHPCALLKHVKALPPLRVDEGECKKCKVCMKLGCPAISFDKEKGASIDPNQCTGCGLCQKVCKFNAILKEGGLNE